IDKLSKILEVDSRYHYEAYIFVLEALAYTLRKLEVKRHITGRELLGGIRDLAQEKFGLMVKSVFAYWGIKETLDFGHIVFNLVECGLLKKTTEDKLEDFKDVYDFEEVFVRNYPIDVDREKIRKAKFLPSHLG
ncbi:MAG: Minf_1886 family protein, partial [candidate division WOR-3 bacterium]